MDKTLLRLLLLVSSCSLACGANIGATRQNITHYSDGGYGTLLIAINDNVPEDRSLLTDIQVRKTFTCS